MYFVDCLHHVAFKMEWLTSKNSEVQATPQLPEVHAILKQQVVQTTLRQPEGHPIIV